MKAIKQILVFTLLLLGSTAQAQDYTYFISSDTIFYPIGGRIMITQEWSTPEGINQEPPNLPVSLAKFEQIEIGDVSSNTVDGRTIFKQMGIYTCFDTGYYEIPGLAWRVNDDSIVSNPLFVEVVMLPIDTSQAIMDVSGPLSIPYTFKELLPYIGGGLVLAALIAAIIIILKRRKQNLGVGKPKAPPKPAHIFAFEQIEALRNKKLWQQGNVSQYHFELSNIIRTYIENRYNADALDLTTGELNILCKELKIELSLISKLIDVLKTGDLAKFAKANPLPNENEEAMRVIEEFVSKTFQKPISETEEANDR
ncbi:MAG: hypothetical protein JXQ87_18885 [Bacteroidia bacterium]